MKIFSKIANQIAKLRKQYIVIVPYFILFIVLIISLGFIIGNCKKQLKENCSRSLAQLSQSIELELSNAIRSATYLNNSGAMMNYLQNNINLNSEYTQYEITSLLNQLCDSSKTIHDAYIIDKSANQIITTYGIYPLDEFFTKVLSYTNHPSDYLTKYNSFSHSSYIILPPSEITFSNETTNVIPIVFSSFGTNTNLSKIVVVNLSINAFANNINTSITPHSKLFILSRYNGDVYGVNTNYSFGNIMDTQLYSDLISDKGIVSTVKDNEKTLFISYNQFSEKLLSFTYFATIPYSDIYRSQSLIIFGLFIFYITFIFITLYISKKNRELSSKLLLNVAYSVAPDNTSAINSSNAIETINSYVSQLKDKENKFNVLLPFVQEQYLIKYLTSTDVYIGEDAKLLIQSSLSFVKEYFGIVIFQLFTKQSFFETFSTEDYDAIFSGLYDTLKSIFSNSFDAHILSCDNETMYILLNSDNTDDYLKVNNTLKEIYTIIQYDNEYVNLYTGVGKFYKSFEGLKKSYNEAMLMMRHIPLHSQEITFTKVSSFDIIINKQIESSLYDALTMFDTIQSKKIIDNLVLNLSNMYTIKHIYIQVVYIILKILRTKNVYNSEIYDGCTSIIDKSCKQIYAYILQLLNIIDEHKKALSERTIKDEIIDYINTNFNNPSISLELLATQFNLTPGYISQLVKKNTETNFREYLLNLRLIHAKKLLIQTDKKIQEIAEESGFYNKATFFRLFKENMGITPTEFRKNNS